MGSQDIAATAMAVRAHVLQLNGRRGLPVPSLHLSQALPENHDLLFCCVQALRELLRPLHWIHRMQGLVRGLGEDVR